MNKPKILAIVGSLNVPSANATLVQQIKAKYQSVFDISVFHSLDTLPHFNPILDTENPPEAVTVLRKAIIEADGVLFCTPEYIFSLPCSLKNVFEWMVSTVIFTNKPSAFIVASSSGEKAYEQLELMLKTVGALLSNNSGVLIKGIKSKVNSNGELTDTEALRKIEEMMVALKHSIS
jgi:chromate reductase